MRGERERERSSPTSKATVLPDYTHHLMNFHNSQDSGYDRAVNGAQK